MGAGHESNAPGVYVGGLAHIHMALSAEGHGDVVITHFIQEGAAEATLELVLPTAGR